MAKYFRITEIDAATFERMTGSELDCLQVAMLADDGNVYVAVDEDRHDCIDVDLEMFDDIGGGPLIEERIHNRCTALSVLEELDSAYPECTDEEICDLFKALKFEVLDE